MLKYKSFIIMFITFLIICFVFSSCSYNKKNNNSMLNYQSGLEQNSTEQSTSDFIQNETNIEKNTYDLSQLPGSFAVSEGYNVYSKDSGYTEEMCKQQGLEYEKVSQLLSLSSYDVMIIPATQKYSIDDFKILIRIKSGKEYYINNLNDLNNKEINDFATGLVTGFGESKYDIVEGNNKKFIVFNTRISLNELRYATMLNNKMIYVFAQYNNSITDKQKTALREIALSIKTD